MFDRDHRNCYTVNRTEWFYPFFRPSLGEVHMIRILSTLALGLMLSVNAQAALLANYTFATNLSPTTVAAGVTVSALTPISNRVAQVATDGGVAQFTGVGVQSPFSPSATFTITAINPLQKVLIETMSFDLRKLIGGNGELQITNNVDGQVFLAQATSTSYQPKPYVFAPKLLSNSVTFTFARRSINNGTANMLIDNLQVNGVIPEPASMAIFGVLGLAGVVYRRRMNKA